MDIIVLLESLKKKSEKINWWQGHLNDIKPNTNARKSYFVTDLWNHLYIIISIHIIILKMIVQKQNDEVKWSDLELLQSLNFGYI